MSEGIDGAKSAIGATTESTIRLIKRTTVLDTRNAKSGIRRY